MHIDSQAIINVLANVNAWRLLNATGTTGALCFDHIKLRFRFMAANTPHSPDV